MATRALLEDEITVLDHSESSSDNEQPGASGNLYQNYLGEEQEDGYPGIVVTFQGPGASEHCLPVPDQEESNSIEENKIRTYAERWYVLFAFALLGFIQGYYTLSWNVIATSVEAAFGWTNTTLSTFQLWLYITYVFAVFPFAYLMSYKGLRVAVVTTALILSLGTVFRCLSTTPPAVTWFTHISHMLVGISGPVVFAGGPVLSAMWFAPNERSTATAVMTIAGFAGSAFSFIVGPLVVDEPKEFNTSLHMFENFTTKNYSNIDKIKEEILHLRYGECGVCVLLTIMILVHFPSKPKTPPSLTASMDKMALMESVKKLFSSRESGCWNFWLIGLAYGAYTGIYAVWSGLMAINFAPLGVSEFLAGWIGFGSVAAGCLFAVLFGMLADRCWQGSMKIITLALLFGCLLSTLWILLMSDGHLPYSRRMLIAACIIQGICNNAPVPLFYEMAIESAYPIPEVTTSCMLSVLFNCFPPIFLCLFFFVTQINWMDWALLGSLIFCFPLILAFKASYKRLAVDTHAPELPKSTAETEDNIEQDIEALVPQQELNDGIVRARNNVPQYGSINS